MLKNHLSKNKSHLLQKKCKQRDDFLHLNAQAGYLKKGAGFATHSLFICYKRCSTLMLKVSRIVKAAISASRNMIFSPSKAYS